MIIRLGGRSTEVATVTPQAVREVFEAYDVRRALETATLELARESANGPSLALRRLREKVKRLQKRLARFDNEILRDASDNPEGKASA